MVTHKCVEQYKRGFKIPAPKTQTSPRELPCILRGCILAFSVYTPL